MNIDYLADSKGMNQIYMAKNNIYYFILFHLIILTSLFFLKQNIEQVLISTYKLIALTQSFIQKKNSWYIQMHNIRSCLLLNQ